MSGDTRLAKYPSLCQPSKTLKPPLILPLQLCSTSFFHSTVDQRIHQTRPRAGERYGATIFYAICDTKVMTKNVATLLPKWA